MLDDGDQQIIARMNDLVGEVIRLWHGLLQKEPATEATGMLLVRCSASWKSICKILENCHDEDELELCGHDAAALLRCMHDVCLQAEYIAAGDAADGLSADDLGRLFLDYEHVERYRMSNTAVGRSSALADLIRSSPARPAGEARNQAEYDRVKGNYPVKPGKPQVRRQWYPGNLAEVADKLGLKEEYFWFTTILHSSIHGGPMSCRRGPAIQGAGLIVMTAVAIIRRVIDVVVRMNGLELSAASREMMTATKGDLLNPSTN